MKVRSALKKVCKHCFFETKGKKVYVRCPANPRHKQRQGFCTIKTPFDNEIASDFNELTFEQLWISAKIKI